MWPLQGRVDVTLMNRHSATMKPPLSGQPLVRNRNIPASRRNGCGPSVLGAISATIEAVSGSTIKTKPVGAAQGHRLIAIREPIPRHNMIFWASYMM